MTTTNGIATDLGQDSVGPMLLRRGYRKIANGQWISKDGIFKVFSYGDQPLKGWKIFRLEGIKFNMIPGATGEGSLDLENYLSKLT
jgi:hypothetical protein